MSPIIVEHRADQGRRPRAWSTVLFAAALAVAILSGLAPAPFSGVSVVAVILLVAAVLRWLSERGTPRV